jgi:hypothetical protein
MIALYEIGSEYRSVLTWDIDSELDAEALCQLLGEIEARFEDKAAAVVAFIRNVDAEAEAYKQEEDRLKEHRVRLEKRSANLKKYLEIEMRGCGFDELKTGLAHLKFVKNPWSVDIEPGADIPNQYLRFRDPEPDKAALKTALERGEEIEGVRLTQTERLRIT